MTIEERLDQLEFRQQLLFHNTKLDRLLFEANITKNQYFEIMNLFDEFKQRIQSGKKITLDEYEQRVYEILPNHEEDDDLAEALAVEFHKNQCWEEVYQHLYGRSR